ncbi:hypothetical protein J4231_03290 [Candidatus Woesearchaeota archaeon]|nr:hypothetical protein [Candidatus Woesearchaeota archaeon]
MGGYSIGKNMMLWLVKITFIVVPVVFLVGYAVNEHDRRDININKIEGKIILNRLFYSEDCFAYNDGVRTYVGTIDLKKFNDERIGKCLDGDYDIKAELTDLGKAAYNRKENYERNVVFCKFENKFYCHEEEDYVLVNDDGVLKNDKLRTSLVLQLSK